VGVQATATPRQNYRRSSDRSRAYGFLRIHRNHAINLARIQEIRRRKGSEDWEVKLEAAVNLLLPVSRGQIGKLLTAYRTGK